MEFLETYAETNVLYLKYVKSYTHFCEKVINKRIERINEIVKIFRLGLLTYRESLESIREEVNKAMTYVEGHEHE
jgi:hypothetical protein